MTKADGGRNNDISISIQSSHDVAVVGDALATRLAAVVTSAAVLIGIQLAEVIACLVGLSIVATTRASLSMPDVRQKHAIHSHAAGS